MTEIESLRAEVKRLHAAIATSREKILPCLKRAENAYLAVDAQREIAPIQTHLEYLWAAIDEDSASTPE